jgi:hypothetical protein
VAAVLGPLIEAGLVATCGVIEFELGWATRTSPDFDELRADRDTGYEWLAVHDEDWRRAVDVQATLWRSGRIRAVGFPRPAHRRSSRTRTGHRAALGQRLRPHRRHHRPAHPGFLARLAISSYAGQLILKGGVLLAAYEARWPTRDVDLRARRLPDQATEALSTARHIAGLPLDDGLSFDTANATAHAIRDTEAYSGVRVTLTAQLATARLTFHVDMSTGDPIWPAPQIITLRACSTATSGSAATR